MMRKEFSDEDLTAYLDGEAAAELSKEIDAALDQDAAIRLRIEALKLPMAPMNAGFDALLGAAPEMDPLPRAPVQHQGVSVPMLFAAIAASLFVGVFVSFWALQGERTRDWRDYVAAYHALYVNGTLATVQADASNTSTELAQLGTVIGHDLSAAPGDPVLDYKRGQVLGYRGQPLVQLAYLSPLGDPVALCLIRAGGDDTGVTLNQLEGLAAAQWQRDGVAFLLIGGTDPGFIREAALRFSEAL